MWKSRKFVIRNLPSWKGRQLCGIHFIVCGSMTVTGVVFILLPVGMTEVHKKSVQGQVHLDGF